MRYSAQQGAAIDSVAPAVCSMLSRAATSVHQPGTAQVDCWASSFTDTQLTCTGCERYSHELTPGARHTCK